jgi:hypothetical protein
VGRHRAEDRVRPGLPAAGHLALAAPGHRHHPAGRRRGLRRHTRCGPGWPATSRSATGPAGSPKGPRSSPSRSAWPGKSPTTCWPTPGRHGHRGPSPRSCPACRSWSWPWGTALAHMLRADADADDTPDSRTGPPAVLRSLSWSSEDQDGPDRRRPDADRDGSARRDQNGPDPGPQDGPGISGSGPRPAQPQLERARIVARRLAAAGKPVSRRALRSGGVKGSNQALSALAHLINAERAGVPTAGENRAANSA